ncbi:MAG TPA: WxL domain-containing protein [Frankiaceae bacterium]|nr:WxL domain-containing protein [Frankiaceae bacterium]
MSSRAKKTVLGGIALAAVTVLAFPGAAFAGTGGDVPGTATLTAGTMSLVQPDTIDFTATLNGADQAVTAPQDLQVLDNTGNAAGWNITLAMTPFHSLNGDLPASAVSDFSAATPVCDALAPTCTIATNTVTYPLALTAAALPVAVEIESAASGTGMLSQSTTHTMQLAIPAAARAGSYTSTWTYSVVSGP